MPCVSGHASRSPAPPAQRLPLHFGMYIGSQAADHNAWKPQMGPFFQPSRAPHPLSLSPPTRFQAGWRRTAATTQPHHGCSLLCAAAPVLCRITRSCSPQWATPRQCSRCCQPALQQLSATACESTPAPCPSCPSPTSTRCSQTATFAAGDPLRTTEPLHSCDALIRSNA